MDHFAGERESRDLRWINASRSLLRQIFEG
jgi:hypothetical protein